MSRLVFGEDEPPVGKPVPMAYIVRATCGHIVMMVSTAAHEPLELLSGVVYSFEPLAEAQASWGQTCDVCQPPEQTALFV